MDIDLPNRVEKALSMDNKSGNSFWADAIANKMENVRVVFDILSDKIKVPIGH